jgi:hypothetical protein
VDLKKSQTSRVVRLICAVPVFRGRANIKTKTEARVAHDRKWRQTTIKFHTWYIDASRASAVDCHRSPSSSFVMFVSPFFSCPYPGLVY